LTIRLLTTMQSELVAITDGLNESY
jgi:hypothetical protein